MLNSFVECDCVMADPPPALRDAVIDLIRSSEDGRMWECSAE